MVTKYDLFEYMYTRGLVKPKEILTVFKHTHYQTIYQIFIELEKEKLIEKANNGFQIISSDKSNLLYRLINFCIHNDINYNLFLEKNTADFISKSFLKKKFSIKDFRLNPRTFAKYTGLLYKNGFLILLSKKPLSAILPYNDFLGDILRYFGYKVLVSRSVEEDYLKEIKNELKVFKNLRKKNERKYKEIGESYEIKFIQHSLNLEGNPITLPETVKLLKEKVVPKEVKLEYIHEVENYQKAVIEMIKDSSEGKTLTKDRILSYHKLAMQHCSEIAGKLRKVNVVIRGNPNFKIAKAKDIEKRLDAMLEIYNNFIKKKKPFLKDIFSFAAYFHNEFQFIHPFIDGNSRTTRLITFHFLRSQDIPVFDIPLGLLDIYLSSTKASKKRNDKELIYLLQKVVLYNLKLINEKLS